MKFTEIRTIDPTFLITESRTYKLWENAGQKIVEAQLTPQQIQQLFQQIEQGSTAAGGNRTMIGKTKDVASAVNQAWENLKTKVSTSGPIKNVDAMYDKAAEKLKQATGGDTGVMKYVQMYRDFAKKHPVAQGLIYSALIAAAGISGAGLGSAAALGLFKMVDKLLQGEKFSSAAYSGAKTGAAAYAAGQIGQHFKGQDAQTPIGQGVDSNNLGSAATGAGQAARSNAQSAALEAVKDAIKNGETRPTALEEIAKGAMEKYSTLGGGQLNPETIDAIAAKIPSVVQGGVPVRESINLSESQIYLLMGTVVNKQQLNEGFIDSLKGAAKKAKTMTGNAASAVGQKIKGAASNAASAIGQKATTMGHNMTTKVTADKLLQAWKKAGSPADSKAISQILQSAGVSPEIVKQTFKSMKIPYPRGPAKPKPGAQAFGQMAGQLGQQSPISSTGGTTTSTPGGLKHTANPENPNQPPQQGTTQQGGTKKEYSSGPPPKAQIHSTNAILSAITTITDPGLLKNIKTAFDKHLNSFEA